MTLKAYIVHDGDPSEGCTLVFAANVSQAKMTGLKTGWLDDYIAIRAVRKPEFDHCAGDGDKPWYAARNADLPDGVIFFVSDDYYDNSM
jgi:hypothetical protein